MRLNSENLVHTLWFPPKVAKEKFWLFLDEYFVNIPRREWGNRAAYELLREPGGEELVRQYLQTYPPRPGKTIDEVLDDARLECPNSRYLSAYQKSGGLLNLLLPFPEEQYDEVWNDLYRKYFQSKTYTSETERQQRLREIGLLWNDIPNDLFSMLTPAQVWAGAGILEAELTASFLQSLQEKFKDRKQQNGEVTLEAILFLRGWQNVPLPSYGSRSAFEIIRSERTQLQQHKEKLLGFQRPVILFHITEEVDKVIEMLVNEMKSCYPSRQIEKAVQLWVDYREKNYFDESSPELWAATIEYTINRVQNKQVDLGKIAAKYHVGVAEISTKFQTVRNTLKLHAADNRYDFMSI